MNENMPARTDKFTVTVKANSLITKVASDKKLYVDKESALIFIALIDSKDQFIDPDSLRVVIDNKEVEAEKKKVVHTQ